MPSLHALAENGLGIRGRIRRLVHPRKLGCRFTLRIVLRTLDLRPDDDVATPPELADPLSVFGSVLGASNMLLS